MDENELKTLFGKKIKEIRKSRKLTQEELSELVCMDPQHFCKMENGNHFPTIKNIIKIANILNVDIKDLFSYDNKNENILINKINYEIKKLNANELKFIYNIIISLDSLK